MQRNTYWKTPSRENRYGLFYRNAAVIAPVANNNAEADTRRESDTRIVVGGTSNRSHIMGTGLLFKRKEPIEKTLEFLLDLALTINPRLSDCIGSHYGAGKK